MIRGARIRRSTHVIRDWVANVSFGFEERIFPVVTSRLGPGGMARRSGWDCLLVKGDRTGLPAFPLVEAGRGDDDLPRVCVPFTADVGPEPRSVWTFSKRASLVILLQQEIHFSHLFSSDFSLVGLFNWGSLYCPPQGRRLCLVHRASVNRML